MDILKLPNLLTLSRIVLMWPLIWTYVQYKELSDINYLYYCIALGFIGGLTDYLDGYFARKLNMSTQIGKILDPLADKIGIAALIITFYYFDQLPFWVLAVILGRDLLIVIGALFLIGKVKEVPSSEMAGKITAFLLAILMFTYILELNSFEPIILVATILMIVYSLLDYILKFIRLNQKKAD